MTTNMNLDAKEKFDVKVEHYSLKEQEPIAFGELVTSYGFQYIMVLLWSPMIVIMIILLLRKIFKK